MVYHSIVLCVTKLLCLALFGVFEKFCTVLHCITIYFAWSCWYSISHKRELLFLAKQRCFFLFFSPSYSEIVLRDGLSVCLLSVPLRKQDGEFTYFSGKIPNCTFLDFRPVLIDWLIDLGLSWSRDGLALLCLHSRWNGFQRHSLHFFSTTGRCV